MTAILREAQAEAASMQLCKNPTLRRVNVTVDVAALVTNAEKLLRKH